MRRKSFYTCTDCGEDILEGESFVKIDGDYYHLDCIKKLSTEDLLELMDIDVKEAGEDEPFEINHEIEACIFAATDAETGEVIGEYIDTAKLESLQIARDEKLENAALWYKNLIADADAFKAEKRAFEAREKQARVKAESLKKYLDMALQGAKFSTARCDVTYRRSEAVEVEDGADLPNEFLKFKDPEPDKIAIKKAIKNGEVLDGCRIIEKQNISIR